MSWVNELIDLYEINSDKIGVIEYRRDMPYVLLPPFHTTVTAQITVTIDQDTGASPALMGTCAQRNIDLTFMSGNGRFLARITGETKGNVTLRKQQYRISEDKEKSVRIARNFILGKVYNSRWVLERTARDYALRLDVEKIKRKSAFLAQSIVKIRECESAEELLGIEGEAASVYFSVFDDLILQQKTDFYFQGRNKRPPLDSVNAMLSFAYSLLAGMCGSALEAVGLDSYVGFFHTDRPGRISLALDLMEEFRSVMADRFVLTLINKKIMKPEYFIKKENGAVIMNDEGRKVFLSAYALCTGMVVQRDNCP